MYKKKLQRITKNYKELQRIKMNFNEKSSTDQLQISEISSGIFCKDNSDEKKRKILKIIKDACNKVSGLDLNIFLSSEPGKGMTYGNFGMWSKIMFMGKKE